MKILAVLQARVSSTRLPGKVLLPVLGEPMLLRQIERVRRSQFIDKLVVATSTDPSDDALESLCRSAGVECFRGSLLDVLDRFVQAARPHQPEHVVRLTGDCPLADPVVIDEVIKFHLEDGYDYSSNTLEPTYPDGLDVEIMRYTVLEEIWRTAVLPSQREHVTLSIYQQPDRFRLGSFRAGNDLSRLRWTVDEPADYNLVCRIYEALYPVKPFFTTVDIVNFLDRNPELKSMNTIHQRNEGLEKSLSEDVK